MRARPPAREQGLAGTSDRRSRGVDLDWQGVGRMGQEGSYFLRSWRTRRGRSRTVRGSGELGLVALDGGGQALGAHAQVLGVVEGEGEAQVVLHLLAKARTRQEAYLVVLRGLCEKVGSHLALGELDQHKVAALRHLVGRALREVLVERLGQRRVPRPERLPHLVQVLILQAHVNRLLHDAEGHRVEPSARVELAAVRNLLEELRGALDPAHAQCRGQDLGERPEGEDGALLVVREHGRRGLDVREGEHLVHLVRDEEELVLGAQHSQLLAAVFRERAASRVVRRGHHIHHGWNRAFLQRLFQRVHIESVLIHGDLAAVEVVVLEDALGEEIGRLFGKDNVTSLSE
mmetsp:Transcript_8819/g.25203  ORF Transcript_8819/g.25203 Transcript_8819/m.25203 type:complete len:346 (+) Transcript_8819:96-1133(+)